MKLRPRSDSKYGHGPAVAAVALAGPRDLGLDVASAISRPSASATFERTSRTLTRFSARGWNSAWRSASVFR